MSGSPSGNTGAAAPAPVRRGRGTFRHQLRTEEMEKQASIAQGRAEEGSTIITTTLVLPSSTLGYKGAKPVTEEEEIAAQFAHLKKGKDIPLSNAPSLLSTANALLATAKAEGMTTRERLIAAAEARANAQRMQFGHFEGKQEDTAREILFRGEKRRRYCVIVGDLQNQMRQVTLKLFGHKGAKPFKLQNKMIRLVNLSIGKPRRGTQQWLAAHGIVDPEEQAAYQQHLLNNAEGEDELSDMETEEGEQEVTEEEGDGEGEKEEVEKTEATPNLVASVGERDAAALRERQRKTHAAAGFDVEDLAPASRNAADAVESADAVVADDENDKDKATRGVATTDDAALQRDTTSNATSDAETGPVPASGAPPALSTAVLEAPASEETQRHADPTGSPVPAAAAAAASSSLPNAVSTARSPAYYSRVTEGDGEDVDHYQDVDEVVPLTVQQEGTSTSVLYENSVANSPVLTARRFAALHDYFLREFRLLMSLEDVRAQNVSININLGAAYCCLSRQGSYSTPLKHATFGEFVERMNAESMQLYFIKDCPTCVSRAVDSERGSLNFAASSTTVKIIFFSNERQSRLIARAVWDSVQDQFRLLDVENIGIAFNWSVFALDETFVRRKADLPGSTAASTTAGVPADASAARAAAEEEEASTTARAPPSYRSPAAGVAARTRVGPAPVGAGEDLDAMVSQTHEDKVVASHQRNDDDDTTANASSSPDAAKSPQKSTAATAAAVAAMEEDDEDDLARNKTVAYPFEVEFRAFRRWKQQTGILAAPVAKAILEELSLAEHKSLMDGSSAAYERMELTNVCELDFEAEDMNVESIVVEHTSRVKPEGTDLLVDNTTSLFIENFAAARQLKQNVASYGPKKVAAMQNPDNNNYLRALWIARRAEGRSVGRDAHRLSSEELIEVLKPTSKLTFFRSRGSTIHWKMHPRSSAEENIAPVTEAMSFLQQVLHTANDIERNSARGGAAPDAL